MSVRRPPPGQQVAAGRIRVDATRALAKLRAYRLSDPTAWITEAIRAAVASGATRIALDGDADDVWLRWQGPAWPAGELPALFDELVSPEQGRASYHRRLLASAINSALGLAPSWIDVVAAAGGAAMRVRFTSEADDAGLAAPAPAPEPEPTPWPEALDGDGMVVHLRRPLGLAVVARFLRGAEPPELTLARAVCGDLAVPMTIAGVPVGRAQTDLLRVPLGEGLPGFVALFAPGPDAEATIDAAELGVRVARDPWQAAPGAAIAGAARPLRVFIDAPRLPTNASRSQVRHDAYPLDAALRRADAVAAEAVARLIAALRERAPTAADPLRAAALALVASALDASSALPTATRWRAAANHLDGPLAALAALPLLQNAVGGWRPVIAPWHDAVYRGAEPLPAALAPWLDALVWVPPGDAAEHLIPPGRGDDADAAAAAIDDARRRQRRHAEFLGRPVRAARVEPRAAPRVRMPLLPGAVSCVPPDAFAGLTGEVCVYAGDGPATATLLFADRPLDTAAVDAPIALEAVIASAALCPDEHYRRAEDDRARRHALAAAVAGAIRAIEALASDDLEPGVVIAAPRRAPGDDALVRAALAAAHGAGYTVADDTPLALAPAWPTHGHAHVSLVALRGARAVIAIEPGADLEEPGLLPTVIVDDADRALLAALIAPVPVIRYRGETLRRAADPLAPLVRDLAARTAGAVLAIRTAGGAEGAIGFASHGSLAIYHRGVRLTEIARTAALVDCAIAITSDAVVPTPDWRAIHDDGGVASADLAAWERGLVVATARALLGEPPPALHLAQEPVLLDDATGRGWCTALAAGGAGLLGGALVARLRERPLWHTLGGRRRSADALLAAFPTAVPVVSLAALEENDPELADWPALLADDVARRAFEALTGRLTVDGAIELARRRAAAVRDRHLAALRARPASPVTLAAECAPIALADARGVVGVAPEATTRLAVTVWLEGRRCATLVSDPDLPAIAAIEVDAADLGEELTTVAPHASTRLLTAARRGAARWAIATAETRPTWIADHGPTRRLIAALLADAGDDLAPLRDPLRDAIRYAPGWPTVQGNRCAPAQAVRGGLVRITSWLGDWLAGPPADPLDAPVIAVPEGAPGDVARAILDRLDPWMTDDVTAEVRRLQVARRIAHAVIAAPRVPGADPAVTRSLDALGVAHTFGAGEIALVDADRSTLLLHDSGELTRRMELDATPAVHLAFEGAELVAALLDRARVVRLREEGTRLAAALVTAVLAGPAEQPPWLPRRLRRAALAAVGEPLPVIASAPVFPSLDGRMLTWRALAAQQVRFGAVWFVTAPPAGPPLDPARLVVVLEEADVPAARSGSLRLTEASELLARDARIRANRARAAVTALEVPDEVTAGALAQLALPPGARGEHGVVVALRPAAAGLRGVIAHRGLVPFDRVGDPCRWPVFAIVEDPGLEPDDTWSTPRPDATWRALTTRIEDAATAALAGAVRPPPGVAAHVAITAWHDPDATGRAVTGALWLDERPGVIQLSTEHGDLALDAPDALPLSGRLHAFPDRPAMPAAVAALVRHWYPILAARAGRTAPPPPTAAPRPVPPHPLRPLADALALRLGTLGQPGALVQRVELAGTPGSPLVALEGRRLVLAADAPLLRRLAAALAARAPEAAAAIDALAGHALAVLHRDHPALTDDSERAALTALVAPPR